MVAEGELVDILQVALTTIRHTLRLVRYKCLAGIASEPLSLMSSTAHSATFDRILEAHNHHLLLPRLLLQRLELRQDHLLIQCSVRVVR